MANAWDNRKSIAGRGNDMIDGDVMFESTPCGDCRVAQAGALVRIVGGAQVSATSFLDGFHLREVQPPQVASYKKYQVT